MLAVFLIVIIVCKYTRVLLYFFERYIVFYTFVAIIVIKLSMENTLPLVSVVIPVYNSEQYLDRCLQSVTNQSYKRLEIIVVNDGSVDSCPSIIRKYAKRDSRVVIIDKENEGLVEARKTGVSSAHGKYIQYLDSDDALIGNAIELLLDKAESAQADMVVAPFNFIEEGKRKTSDIFEFELMSGVQYLKHILKSEAYWTVWSKFHLRSLYFNNIESLDIAFGEDVVLSSQLLINSDKVVPISSPIVDYYVYPSSMSHCLNDKAYQDFTAYVSWFDDYIKRRELGKELAEELAFFHIKNTITRLHWRKNKDTDREMKRLVEEIQTYPKLTQILSRREKKIVSIYKVSTLLGYWKLLYYSKRGKI